MLQALRKAWVVPVLAALISVASEAQMKQAEPIGIPIKSVVFGNSHAVLGPSPGGSADMFYIPYYSTTGSALVGYHAGTDELVSIELGSSGGYGCCVGGDGALYIGGVNPGDLYRFDPTTGELRNLGGRETGATYIWATAASADGKVYGACYPTCNVVEYDIASGEMRDLGRVDPDEQYCRSICVDAQGKVWVGVGTHAHLYVLDPRTGEKRDVLPEKYREASSCYDLAVSGKYVVASLIRGINGMLVFDAETAELVAEIPQPPDSIWWMNTRGAPEGHAYMFSVPDGHLYDYDIEAKGLALLAENLGQCEMVVDQRYVHGVNDQDYFLYDLKEKEHLARKRLTEAGDGMAVYTLAAGADGNIYGSTYINQHIFKYDTSAGELADLGKVIRVGGQVDSMALGHDGKLYMGAYVLAHLATYDPSKPWSPSREPDGNPRELGSLGQGQYRTQAIALGPDNRVWVGSIPSYNSGPTGGFSCWDPATGEHKTWTDLVPGGAVHDIAAGDRYLYCAGGGEFFVWDPVNEIKVFEDTRGASAMAVAPNGMLVGSSGDELFVFDPEAMEIARTFASPVGAMDFMATSPDGKIYGINSNAVARIDPAEWQVDKIAEEGGRFLAIDHDGVLYFARGSQLFRMK